MKSSHAITQIQAVFSVSRLVDKAGRAISRLLEAKYNPQAFASLQKEKPDQLKNDLGVFYRCGCEIAARHLADSQPALARERQQSLATMKMAANGGRLTIAQRIKRWFKHNEKNSSLSRTAAQIANIADQRYEAAAIVSFLKENCIQANRQEFKTLSGEMANVADFRNEFVCKMAGGKNGEAILARFDAWLSPRLETADHLQAGKAISFQGDGKGERMRETAADVLVSKFIPPQAVEAAAQHPQGLPEEAVRSLQMEKTEAIINGQLAQEQPVVASVKTLNRIVPAPQTEAALEREVGKVVREALPAPEPYKPDPWEQERQAKIDEASAISWQMREIANNLGAYGVRTYLGDESTPQGKRVTVQGITMSLDLEHLDAETGGRLDELMGPRGAALREAARQLTLTEVAEKHENCTYDAEKDEFRIGGRLYDTRNHQYENPADNDDMGAMTDAMRPFLGMIFPSIRLTAEATIRQYLNSEKSDKQYSQTYSMKIPVPEGIQDMPAFKDSGLKFRDGQAYVIGQITPPAPEIPSAAVALEMLETRSAKLFNHEAIAAARQEFADAERLRAEEARNSRQEVRSEERSSFAMAM